MLFVAFRLMSFDKRPVLFSGLFSPIAPDVGRQNARGDIKGIGIMMSNLLLSFMLSYAYRETLVVRT